MPTQHFEPNAQLVLPVTARSGSTIAALWVAARASWAAHARAVEEETTCLEQVPVYLLRGTGIPLELFGLRTLGEIKVRVTLKQLAAQLGEVAAKPWSLATGLDARSSSVYAPPVELIAQFNVLESISG
jgi:hypothetical protein